MDTLEQRLGYHFNDRSILEIALTHRSASDSNNERLEFLGDAALGCVIAAWLWRAFPDSNEHLLTLMRASLVKKLTLARVAREIELGEHLRLGAGESRSGGRDRDSILADTLEAIFGATFQDGGYEAVCGVVWRLFARHVENLDHDSVRDSKTRLQELIQARQLPLPDYLVVSRSGDEHQLRFCVECRIETLGVVTQGHGDNRREAEQSAARAALERLEPVRD